jgi:drug/metabolite transporter (DMT)-like permease
MSTILGITMVFIAVIFWSIASIGYKFSLGSVGIKGEEHRDPISAMSIRVIIILIALFLASIIFGDLPGLFLLSSEIALQYWGFALLTGVLSIGADLCYFNALRFLDSSRVYPLVNTQTLFTFPFAFAFGESITINMFFAAALMIIGVLFVGKTDSKDSGMDNLTKPQQKHNYVVGIVLSIATGFFFAMIYLSMGMQNRIFNGIFECNFSRTLCFGIILWIGLLFIPKLRKRIPKTDSKENKEIIKKYILIGLFGVLSFGLGDSLYQIGIIENGPSISIIIASSAPIFNQIFAVTFLKETLRRNFVFGVICIVIGNMLVI